MRLICFPYAGASAGVYSRWKKLLPSWINLTSVELSGHGTRLSDPLHTDIEELIHEVVYELDVSTFNESYALFGHSLGAMIAYEFSRTVCASGFQKPAHLFLSAVRAPDCKPHPSFHTLPEKEFLEKIKGLNGSSSAVLDDPEFARFVVPILRADIEMAASWNPKPYERIEVSATLFNGKSDHLCPPTDMSTWPNFFQRTVSSRTFEGGHFFFESNLTGMLAEIAATIAPENV